jgi:hypothetical protein
MTTRRNLIKSIGILIPANLFGLEALATQPEYSQEQYDKLYLKWNKIIDFSDDTCRLISDNLTKFRCMKDMESMESVLLQQGPHYTSRPLLKELIPMIRRKYSKDLSEPLNDMSIVVTDQGIRISVVDNHTPIYISMTHVGWPPTTDYYDDICHIVKFDFTDVNGIPIFTNRSSIYDYMTIDFLGGVGVILNDMIKDYKKRYTGLL